MTVELRPVVRAFAEEMERKLLKNDHRGGWSPADYEYIWRQMHEHLGKFTLSVYTQQGSKILADGADVANLVMILCDILGLLPIDDSPAEGAGPGEEEKDHV